MNAVPGGRRVLKCQECGDRTVSASWINGIVLCSVCAESDIDTGKPKHLARNWDEFQGRGHPGVPKRERRES